MSVRVVERSGFNIAFRVNVAVGLILASFFLLTLRLWYLQILRGDYFRFRSENNLLRTIYVPPARGLILDRNEEVLASNRPSFDIEFVSEDSPDPRETMGNLAQILDMQPEELMAKLHDQRRRRRFEPKLILRDVSREVVAKVEARRYLLPGVTVNVVPTRQYVYGDLAAHIMGYIREITRDQLENPIFGGYMRGDLVGQFGIESKLEQYLRGDRGVLTIIVNAAGTRIGERSFKPETIGHNVTLTIDRRMQERAENEMSGKRGAVVALDPRTGEVLTLVSTPAFDPNIFSGEVSPDVWKDLTSGTERKMNDRAIQGAYAPGSVFKMFMAVAGLAEGVVTPEERVFCPGFYMFGGRAFKCHKHSGHGSVNLHDAMAQSCDVYFYTVGQRLGIDRIFEYASKFGFAELTGIDLADEVRGIIPSTAWKRAYFKRAEDKKWYPGETLSVAIGQGAVTVSPIQVARGLAALVNGGILYKPQLIRSIQANHGEFHDEDFGPVEQGRIDVDSNIIRAVRNSLVAVVNDPRGTGHKAQLDKSLNITVGGKTGTAQVVSLHRGGADEFEDNAWFAGYAPAENPELVVVALVENGGHGGSTAAPIVQAVMDTYFRKGAEPAAVDPAAGATGGSDAD